PEVQLHAGAELVGFAAIAAVVCCLAFWIYARSVQKRTGRQLPVLLVCLGGTIGLPLVVFLMAGAPMSLVAPQLSGFNFRGGYQLFPEFVALLIGLSVYTAAYIAEIVRGGIQAVPRGQAEAAH